MTVEQFGAWNFSAFDRAAHADAACPFVAAVRAVARASALVGMHGAGLAHCLWGAAGLLVVDLSALHGNHVRDLTYVQCAEWLNGSFVKVVVDASAGRAEMSPATAARVAACVAAMCSTREAAAAACGACTTKNDESGVTLLAARLWYAWGTNQSAPAFASGKSGRPPKRLRFARGSPSPPWQPLPHC